MSDTLARHEEIMSNELTTQEPSVAIMLQGALASIQRGEITTNHVEVLKGMMDLYERNEKREAEKAFARAFAALQAETPSIQAVKAVPNNDGSTRYHYAPFEEVMARVRPLLAKNGFSLSFDTEVAEGRVTAICHLLHQGGFAKPPTRYAVRIGQGPPKATETQSDGAAYTYAKRGALCSALNIVVEMPDDDARDIGKPISAEEAEQLRKRVKAVGANEAAFLKFAGAAHYEAIGEARMQELLDMLEKKEAAKKKKDEPAAEQDFQWEGTKK